jgi:hypothetical protein
MRNSTFPNAQLYLPECATLPSRMRDSTSPPTWLTIDVSSIVPFNSTFAKKVSAVGPNADISGCDLFE